MGKFAADSRTAHLKKRWAGRSQIQLMLEQADPAAFSGSSQRSRVDAGEVLRAGGRRDPLVLTCDASATALPNLTAEFRQTDWTLLEFHQATLSSKKSSGAHKRAEYASSPMHRRKNSTPICLAESPTSSSPSSC